MSRTAITCVVFICFLPGMTHVSGCSSTLTGYSGFFTSPNYPGNYPSNVDCYYTINAGNKPIRLLFLDIGVEVGYDIVKVVKQNEIVPCNTYFYTDYETVDVDEHTIFVDVYNGSNTLLRLLDGSRGMYVIEPATHYTVHFQSDDLLNYRGFNATWTISATALASDVPALVHGRCSYQEDVVRQSSSGLSLSYLELLSTVTIFDCLFVCREDSLCTAFHYLNQGCTLYFNFVCNDTLPALLYVGM